MKDFQVLQELASSGKGRVLKCRTRSRGKKLFVLKERRSAELGRGKNILNEVKLLNAIHHPFIIKLYDHFWENGKLYMKLEFATHGDLSSEIQKRKRVKNKFTYTQVDSVIKQLSSALLYLHEKRIIHRDVKSLNIFISETQDSNGIEQLILGHKGRTVVKLGDLGVSRQQSAATSAVETFYGTPLYASPEICDNKPYGRATDLWSFGVLIYEILQLEHPFKGTSILSLAKQICAVKYSPLPESIPSRYREIVDGLIRFDPNERITADQVGKVINENSEPGGEQFLQGEEASVHTKVLPKPEIEEQEDEGFRIEEELVCNAHVLRLHKDIRRLKVRLDNVVSWHGAHSKKANCLRDEIRKIQRELEDLRRSAKQKSKIGVASTCPIPKLPQSPRRPPHRCSAQKDERPHEEKQKHVDPPKQDNETKEHESKDLDYIAHMRERSERLARRLKAQREARLLRKMQLEQPMI